MVISMGLVAQKLRHDRSAELDIELEIDDDKMLDESEILKCLESDRSDDDAFEPAKGIANGFAAGAILWALGIATFFVVSSI